jgi:hypothetical protein
MLRLIRKNSVTILDLDWNIVLPNLKLNHTPRAYELIYIESIGKYYEVVRVIHNVNDTHSIFLIVEEYNNNIKARIDL